jgi:hypothetical protein
MNTSTLNVALAPLEMDEGAQAYRAMRRRKLWRTRLMPALGVCVLLFGWWAIVVGLNVKPFIAPSPFLVLETLYSKRAVLLDNMIPTALEAAGGFLIGNLVAIVLATIFVHNKTISDIFFPVALMFNAIPVVAKAPVLVLMMGNGVEPKIAIAALVCFFPTLVNMVRGLDSANPQAMELMRVLSASLAHRGVDVGDRRRGGRMDWRHPRHRRADHPGDLQLRLGLAVFGHCHERHLVGDLLPDHRVAGEEHRQVATAAGPLSPGTSRGST